MEERRTSLSSVERALSVLLVFSSAGCELGVSELARRVGVAKSVAYRSLTALVQSGFVTQDPKTRLFRLGPESLALGLAALSSADLPGVALKFMEEIRDGTNETATLSLLVGSERVYAAQIESPQDVRMTVKVGSTRWPLYVGASGRAILTGFKPERLDTYLNTIKLTALTPITIVSADELRANLATVREVGYAVSFGERDPWAASVAATLVGRNGDVVGSISVCGPIFRFTEDRIPTFGALVKSKAEAMSAVLAARADGFLVG